MIPVLCFSQTGSTNSTTEIAKCLTFEEVNQLNAFYIDYQRYVAKSDSCQKLSNYNDSIYRSVIDSISLHINDLYSLKRLQEAQISDYQKLTENKDKQIKILDRKRKWNKRFAIIGTIGGLAGGIWLGTVISK